MFCFNRSLQVDSGNPRNIRTFVAAALLPLTLAACGDTEPSGPYQADNIEMAESAKNVGNNPTAQSSDNLAASQVDASISGNSSAQTASTDFSASTNGKDQVGTNSAQVTVSKLTDSQPSLANNTPTEKVEAAADTAASGDTAAAPAPAANESAAPASTPAVAPPTATAESGTTINSVQIVADDMRLLNDASLAGVDPAFGFATGPGYNVMGNLPVGSNLPAWYTAEFPDLANDDYWNAVLPWFVLFEGEGNSAVNTRVQLRNLKVYVLSRATDQWQLVLGEQDIDGEFCPSGDQAESCSNLQSKRAESSGGISFKPLARNSFHGWFGDRTAIDGADVKAIFVTLQSRLSLGEVAQEDDRTSARYLIDVGADYYPDRTTDLPYVPGAGVSRAKLLSPDWQSFNFMTFSDVGNQEPGGGITESEFRDNPPPLD